MPDRKKCDAAFYKQCVQWNEADDPVLCEESNQIKSNSNNTLT